MKRILPSVLLAGLAAAITPSPRPRPEIVPATRPAEIVCDTAQDGEPFCIVFYPDSYCTTYRSGYEEGTACGD